MQFYFSLPFLFLKFFFVDLPFSSVRYFLSLNSAFIELVSLPLLIRTFFWPWKNEYRKEFIPVAIGVGVGVKSIVILADIVLFFLLLAIELSIVIFLFLWPIVTIGILFL